MNQEQLTTTIIMLLDSERALTVNWGDGHQSLFHYVWLRDNCPCPQSRHASGQRLVETAAIPLDIRPHSLHVDESGAIAVVWANDGHTSRYEAAWLRAHCYAPAEQARRRQRPLLWEATLMDRGLPRGNYREIASDNGALREWLALVKSHGFAILHGVPTEPGMVTEVVALFGYVRETNYGRLFDVKSVADPINLAYTGLALGAHTDNPYRDPVPTLQLLHCLTSSAEGGDSTLVDGFGLADFLRQEEPESFRLLSTLPVRFRFRSDDTDLSAEFPLIQLDTQGEVAGVRFNNRSAAPFAFAPDLIEPYYRAYQRFASLLDDQRFQVRFKLAPGDLFIVDNTRVLHGRTGFASAGERHLQGCYADRDGLYSRLAVLSRQLTA